MTVQILQWTAAVYLAAGLVAGLGLGLETRRIERASVLLLAFGAVLHLVSFALLHTAENPPPVTNLREAFSFMAWVGTVAYLLLLKRSRLSRLVVLVAPAAFLGAFLAALRPPSAAPSAALTEAATGWPHAHVLMASGGLSLLGLAGLVGVIFLIEHARLKAKKPLDRRFPLPSIEALDRVNAVALGVGFLLLTLGVITGMIWLQTTKGMLWSGTAHEVWNLVAWVVYAVLVFARFSGKQSSRRSAISAVAGFVFLLFAVVGLEVIL